MLHVGARAIEGCALVGLHHSSNGLPPLDKVTATAMAMAISLPRGGLETLTAHFYRTGLRFS